MTIFFKGISVAAFVAVAAFPVVSHAWFFSDALAQSASSAQTVEDSDTNIQTVPVLSANVPMTSTLKPVDPDASVAITDNEALAPAIGSMGTLADMIDVPTTDTISTYVVQSGDLISDVAKRFGVSENTIRWANNLSSTDTLHAGETLVILPVTGIKHTVVEGDTLASLAKTYNGDPSDIASYNNIDPSAPLQVGSVVIIPGGEISLTKTVVNKTTGKKETVEITGAQTGAAEAATAASEGLISTPHGYYIRPVVLGPGIEETQGFHTRFNAVDIGAPKGTPIHAMADGIVIVAKPDGWNGGYGGLTIIAHPNGSQTLYAHQSEIFVTVGQHVTQGQVIGGVGNTGQVTGRTGLHLHFEIRGVYPTPVLY